jgi:hypothetical protein
VHADERGDLNGIAALSTIETDPAAKAILKIVIDGVPAVFREPGLLQGCDAGASHPFG